MGEKQREDDRKAQRRDEIAQQRETDDDAGHQDRRGDDQAQRLARTGPCSARAHRPRARRARAPPKWRRSPGSAKARSLRENSRPRTPFRPSAAKGPAAGRRASRRPTSEAATITANGPIRNSRTSARASVEAKRTRIRRPSRLAMRRMTRLARETHRDQDEGDDGGRDEVVGDADALVEQGLQHQHLGAAEHGGRDIGGHRSREDERAADREAFAGQRQGDLPEDLKAVGAENARGGDGVARQVLQRADERKDHQRQQQLQQADEDRRLRKQDAQRLVGQTQKRQRAVDDSRAARGSRSRRRCARPARPSAAAPRARPSAPCRARPRSTIACAAT